jgi:hypothetical protein
MSERRVRTFGEPSALRTIDVRAFEAGGRDAPRYSVKAAAGRRSGLTPFFAGHALESPLLRQRPRAAPQWPSVRGLESAALCTAIACRFARYSGTQRLENLRCRLEGMANSEHFWRLEHLCDRQLLERLQGVLRTQRCALAELIAHLGEVEERRLHLAAAHSSMFSYCVQHLGMSEDEACRRIELARLARRFPALFGELASGRIGLSVALLLKPVLTPDNHAELIAAARGASLRTARELLAERFASPDVPSRIRKLPARPIAQAVPVAVCLAPAIPAADAEAANAIAVTAADAEAANATAVTAADLPAMSVTAANVARAKPAPVANALPARVTSPDSTSSAATAARLSSPPPPRVPEFDLDSLYHAQLRQRIEPLSAERYRIVFTADASLKQKLELARDLLRHSNPSGDLAPVVSRALELLLQELLQRRFGARRRDPPHRAASAVSHSATPAASAAAALETPRSSTLPLAMPAPAAPGAQPPATALGVATPQSSLPLAVSAPARQGAASSVTAPPATARRAAPSLATPSFTTVPPAVVPSASPPASYISHEARRAVLERDGLGCCWVDATGRRCGSSAWLELDHHHPSGKGGGSEPENLRLLCRAHNRFAAERAYGRAHVERAIQARQRSVKGRDQDGQPPFSSPAPLDRPPPS